MKAGRWKGKTGAKFVLFGSDFCGRMTWTIAALTKGGKTKSLYENTSAPGANPGSPPRDGWSVDLDGLSPAPILEW